MNDCENDKRCEDCANYCINRVRQCVAYNNEVSSKDDATHCCEFVDVKKASEGWINSLHNIITPQNNNLVR